MEQLQECAIEGDYLIDEKIVRQIREYDVKTEKEAVEKAKADGLIRGIMLETYLSEPYNFGLLNDIILNKMKTKPIKKKIDEIGFSLFSPEQIKKISVAKIVTPELYDIDGYPVDGGLMDLRLGAIDPGVRCRTCGGRLKECLGHPGSIDLARAVIHLKYVPLIELGLRCFCQECRNCLLKTKIWKN